MRIPNFIIGGAPRSGTTYLAMCVDRHPQVAMAKPFVPEPKIFLGRARTTSEYVDAYAKYFDASPAGSRLGEKSSAYFEDQDVPRRLHQFFHLEMRQRIKLIFIVREPVARAYSNYLRSRANGLEPLSFVEAIETEEQRKSPFGPEKAYVRPFAYASRGLYDVYAERYLELFDRDELHFCLYEDIRRSGAALMGSVVKFLGLEPRPFESMDPGIVNSSSTQEPHLPTGLREDLMPRFRDHVRRFQDLTRLDVDCWGYG